MKLEKEELKISLGRFIAARRKRLHMTQEDLAQRIHVSKSAVAKWETDGGIPDRDNLYKLAEIMGVSVEDLHLLIKSKEYEEEDFAINITPDIIGILESYGFRIMRPDRYTKKDNL